MDLDKINNYLRDNLWMDFELVKVGMNFTELHGFIDEAYNDKIIIRFKSVHMLNIVTHFTYSGKNDFISLIEKEKAYAINVKYDVPIGNKIFLLTNTNISSEMFIIANDIEMEVFN